MQVRGWTVTLLMLFLAAAVQAAQPRIVFSPGAGLTAGEVVTVGWEGLPAEFDECEFLLDLGYGEVIRLTPQLPPGGRSFRWTVPNLPSSAAVLRLRAGIEGVETVLASSGPFAIRGVAHAARVEFRNGEWWIFTPGPPAPDPPVVQPIPHSRPTKGSVPRRHWPLHEGTTLADERRHDVRRVSAARIDTRCGAPLVVPQRK